MAERMKTRLSHTMGVALPSPGIGVFHLTLLVSLQVKGGSACGAKPVASGPRHCGQLRSAAESAQAAWLAKPSASGNTTDGRTSAALTLASSHERNETFMMGESVFRPQAICRKAILLPSHFRIGG